MQILASLVIWESLRHSRMFVHDRLRIASTQTLHNPARQVLFLTSSDQMSSWNSVIGFGDARSCCYLPGLLPSSCYSSLCTIAIAFLILYCSMSYLCHSLEAALPAPRFSW